MTRYLWSTVTVLCLTNLALKSTNGQSEALIAKHACVIGAGYSGLAAARYLQEYDVNFTVYEASRHIGGTWRFDPHVGTDEDGLPLFTSMYKKLRTNTPRQTMEYAGFPFPEDTPSYPSGGCFYKYLQSFVKKFDLMKYIRFRSLVTRVRWANDHWELTYVDSKDKNSYTDACDFIIIASGQYSNPVKPTFQGQDSFKGNIIHSHDYKDPETFRGRKVMVVGAGASGLDLATHLSNVTAKLVHSHHLSYNQPKFPGNYVKKPDIDLFRTDGVIFQDGSYEDIDDVIFCTGYEYNHSFVDESAGLTVSGKFVLPLYQHIVNIRHPTMTFLGVVGKVITRVMDAQAQYAAALAGGVFELPPQQSMLKIWLEHVRSLRNNNLRIIDVNLVGDDMDYYFAKLTEEAGVVRAPPVLKAMRDFNAVNRLEDLLNYRDYDYQILDDNNYDRTYNPRREDTCSIQI
ncbi:PREDICTED: senecionine N-oxygenase-like [Papilio polytes]|uniref:senecionine N-oxygenase-like n=1 Tax=Papilio polytes TaxID=76194 RepID=UPI0006769839|nr:PREDICTED: senecionine N-oxygenase-like [Papilio polytes]